MKKDLFILGLVGTVLLSACSSDYLTAGFSPEEERALVVEASQDSDVPISLGVGMGRAMTRTPIDTEDNLFETPEGQYLGVFCLAAGKQPEAPSFVPSTIDWETHALATWLNNVPARIVKRIDVSPKYNEVQFMTNLESTPEQKHYYYPYGNWYHYNFYAYYPRITEAADIRVDRDSVVVDYELNGKQDIIWGKTTPPESQAYCAEYFRGNNSAETPQYAFVHKLAQLVFKVKATSGNISLEALALKDVCYKLSLAVAGSPPYHEEGELYVNDPSAKKDINVWNSFDLDPLETPIIVPSGSETTIGYMLVPPSSSYRVSVKLSGSDPKECNIGPVGDGKKYTITLEI